MALAACCTAAPAQTAEQAFAIKAIADALALVQQCPDYRMDVDRMLALSATYRIGPSNSHAMRAARWQAAADAGRLAGRRTEACETARRMFGETGTEVPGLLVAR
ncbi:hypothetical protein [Alsobacter sp. R-9]